MNRSFQVKLFLITIVLTVAVLSCKKDKDTNIDRPLVFESLTVGKDTILLTETTLVTALADGDGIEYIWSADMGNIVGGGSVVTYAPTSCVFGNVLVSCTVKDKADNKLSKSVTIHVTL
jgi:hypothetical protein